MGFEYVIYMIVRQIPRGKIATYSQIAALAGKPKECSEVINILKNNRYPFIIPCHRVVDDTGKLTDNFAFGGRKTQKKILLDEGITFLDDRTLDLKKFHWIPCLHIFQMDTRS